MHPPPAGGIDAPPYQAAGDVRLRAGKPRRWPAPLRWLLITLSISGGLCICALIAGVLFISRLEKGPIIVDGLGARIAERLQMRFGPDHAFRLGQTQIEKGQNGPELTIDGLSIAGADGQTILAAPKARVSLDPLALVVGDVTPKRLDVVGLELRLSVMPNGGFAVSAGKTPIVFTPGAAPAPAAAPAAPADPSPGAGTEPPAASGPVDQPAGDVRERSAREALRPAAEALQELLRLATGKGSPLGGLGQFGIVDGRLIFEDQLSRKETVFEGLNIQFHRNAHVARLVADVQGPNGRWQMAVTAANAAQDSDFARTLEVEFSNLTLDEIMLFGGLRDLPFDADMPIHLKFSIGAGQDGEFRMAQGTFGLGSGVVSFRDQDQEPLVIDRVSGGFQWDDTARRFVLKPTQVESAGSRFMIGGQVLPPQSNNGKWSVNLASIGDAQIGPERPGEADIAIGKFELNAEVDPQARVFEASKFVLEGPQVHLSGSMRMWMEGEGRRMQMNLAAERMPASVVMRIWPSAMGNSVRAWLMQNLKSGTLTRATLRTDYNEDAFAAIRARRALPDESLRLEFDLQDVVLSYLPGVNPARGIAGRGVVTGAKSMFTLTQGHVDGGGRQIAITGGSFASTNMAPEASPASVSVNLAGNVETLAAVLGEPGLKQHAALVLDPSTLKGRFDGKLTVDFKAGKGASTADVRVKASATATNLSIDQLMGKERLEGATLQFSVDGKDLSAKGTGRMFGAPATFSFEKSGKADVTGNIAVVLDEQARQKLGWSTGSRLTGPVSMRVSGPLGGKESLQGNVEFDLTRAGVAEIMPGIGKPAGRPAKATFNLAHRADGTTLQNFNYQAGPTSARGTIELDRKGAFVSAALSSLKLSPGDDLAGTISQSGGNLQIALQGAAIDVRPFIQGMTQRASGEGGADPAGRLDLDLQAKLATGHNRQALADLSLKMTRQAGRFSRFELNGRTGRSSVRGRVAPGSGSLEVAAGDGGAVMAFLDLYKRMEGGQLTLTAQLSGTRIDGILNVQNFVLRDEPALRRLVAEGSPRADGGAVKIDPSAVAFERLRLNFSKDGGRIQLHDGVISGPNIGTTLEGMVDFSRDQVNMKGTFVPAYGLNNMFAKVPLFGPLLGGGRNEGLVGVNFSVTGRASGPVLNVNPLSAITPGFLRKIFGAIGSPGVAETPPARPQMPLSLSPAGR